MKYIFIVNPLAGQGNNEKIIREGIAHLPQNKEIGEAHV